MVKIHRAAPAPTDGRLYGNYTGAAATWQDYSINVAQHVWTRLIRNGTDTPAYTLPALPPAQAGRRWELQVEGFLRIGTTKPSTVYVGVALTSNSMGDVHGGFAFSGAEEAMIPLMNRLPVVGGEQVYFGVYTTATGGDTLNVIFNPAPLFLIREVVAQ